MDIEIANTLKIVSAFRILKHKVLSVFNNDEPHDICRPLGVPQKNVFNENERRYIEEFCTLRRLNIVNMIIYARIRIRNDMFTSKLYSRQEKIVIYFLTVHCLA